MLLIVSNSNDETATFLSSALEESGIDFCRFDTDKVLQTLSFKYHNGRPALKWGEHWITPSEIGTVWYRRPEHLADTRFESTPEGRYALSEWTEVVEGFFAHIPRKRWINHPAANSAASNKLEQLSTAMGLGFTIPSTLVTHDPGELRAFFNSTGGRVIAKPMATAYIERPQGEADTLIYTNRVKVEDLESLDDLKRCPTLFQEYIDKQTDVRITIVDEAIHAFSLSAADAGGEQLCDIRRDNMSDVRYAQIELPQCIVRSLRTLMANYGLRFAAIDMAVTKNGEWIFFEVNANGQWAWLDIVGVSDIASSFKSSFREGSRQ